jgi:hypothetical protein
LVSHAALITGIIFNVRIINAGLQGDTGSLLDLRFDETFGKVFDQIKGPASYFLRSVTRFLLNLIIANRVEKIMTVPSQTSEIDRAVHRAPFEWLNQAFFLYERKLVVNLPRG